MHYIFDWDGTLSDSCGRIVECVQAAACTTDMPVRGEEEISNIIGLGLYEAMAVLYPEHDRQTHEKLKNAYSEHYRIIDEVPCGFFEGVIETLDSLRQEGHSLSVATGKSRRGLDRVLKALGMTGYFDATRCADETQSKPHPKMLQELLVELGADRQETVMVGDTEYDLEMATNAEVHSIGVSYGVHSNERLHKHGPLMIVDNITELLGFSLPG